MIPPMPRIAGPWKRVVEYPTNHLNDFCIFRDRQGTWHIIGIQGSGKGGSETSLFHCSCPELLGQYEKHPAILGETAGAAVPGTENRRTGVHAPFVVERGGVYHLFYRRPYGTILRVRTQDPYRWAGPGELVFEAQDARDVCVVSAGDEYWMYYCQYERVENAWRSCIFRRRSPDLEHWSEPVIVYVDRMKTHDWSYLESPCVVRRPEGCYLFIRHRLLDERCTTIVLFSEQPDRFPQGERPWLGEFDFVHAPEIVEVDGRFYIARVSGARHANPFAPLAGGWVEIAELVFS